MGFFTTSPKPVIGNQPQDELTYDEDYIQKALRLPSAGDGYENEGFKEHFSENIKLNREGTLKNTLQADQKLRTHRFSNLFRKRDKASQHKVEGDPNVKLRKASNTRELKPTERHSSIRITERQINDDDNSSIQDSTVQDDATKSHSLSGLFWRSRRKHYSPSGSSANRPAVHRRGFRSLFRHTKPFGSFPETINSSGTSSSVYEVKETLTQRYLNNGYENLLKDMEAVPFDLTVKENNTLHTKVFKALQAMSPSKKSDIGSATRSPFDDFTEESTWNPYARVIELKNEAVNQNSFSTSSSEVESSKESNEKLGIQRRTSIFGSFKRCLSFRSKHKDSISSSSTSGDADGPSSTVIIKNINNHNQDRMNNNSVSPQKETLSSLFGPEEHSDFIYTEYPSSDSSNTFAGDDVRVFGKLYAKTLDATENKISKAYALEDQNLSGSTKYNSPPNGEKSGNTDENIDSASSKSKSANNVYQNVVANFASMDNETYNSEDVSSFLQEYYDPTRPSTKEELIQKTTPALSRRSSSRKFGSIRGNPFQINNLTEESRPLTALDQYLKQVKEDKQELDELTTLIKRDRSRHKKVLNGIGN